MPIAHAHLEPPTMSTLSPAEGAPSGRPLGAPRRSPILRPPLPMWCMSFKPALPYLKPNWAESAAEPIRLKPLWTSAAKIGMPGATRRSSWRALRSQKAGPSSNALGLANEPFASPS